MTLAVAFVRQIPRRDGREELVFASDSRLSGGQRLDHGTKVFELPRSDALLAFAGQTEYAYPLALQLIAAIRTYPPSSDRRSYLGKARWHMLRVFEQVYRSIHGLPVGQDLPLEDVPPIQFLFGGFVWQKKQFRIWYIDLDRAQRAFRFRQAGRCFFIGDREAVLEARARTSRLLEERGRDSASIDMEPIEVLRDIIRERRHPGVGGAPQMAKVYEHMNSQFFATWWEHEDEVRPHIFGRPLLRSEFCSWPMLDPDELVIRVARRVRGSSLLDEDMISL